MKSDSKHLEKLIPEAREMLLGTDEDRLLFIQIERWTPYPQADNILDRMESLFNAPERYRTSSMMLVGEPNNGKTSLVRRFCSLHPKSDGWSDDPPYPVMYVQAPPVPDERRFYDSILGTLLVPFRHRDAPSEKLATISYYFNKLGTRMLIVDEIHNILSGSPAKQRAFLNALKNLSNHMQIPLVLVGTKEALTMLNTDEQLSSRFRPEKLPKWKPEMPFLNLLANLESTLPLKLPSNLASPELAPALYDMSEGIIGEVATLISEAAGIAIKNGSERIGMEEIKAANVLPPSKRLADAALEA
jgi:hypothetical protein